MKKILEDIKTNTYERFYLFYGEEKYMISKMKNQLKKALVSEDDTMNYSYFEGKRADAIEIVELAKTLPFFSDHRFLILDETGLGKKSDDTFIEGLKEASDTSVVLFIEDSVDKRSKIYKFLSKEGHAVCFESAGDKELSRWLISLLKKEGKQMSSATMRSFLYRCGSDMYTLKNELEKLISYVGEREEITIRDLIKASLRMRPDRIIVGEVRGEEALSMLNAMNTGHDGSISTGHANSCKDMLKRIETMVLMGVDMPVEAIRGQMASAIDVIIHLGRSFDGSRKLMEISEITGMAASQVALHPLFEMNEDDELTMRSELCDQKKLKEYGQYEAYQKLMESFKARDQPVEI